MKTILDELRGLGLSGFILETHCRSVSYRVRQGDIHLCPISTHHLAVTYRMPEESPIYIKVRKTKSKDVS